MGNHTTYERNIQNQVLKMTDPMGNSTTYGYDERGNMTVTTDANGHSTTYTYDAAGQMISMTTANGGTWSYKYDKDGRQVSSTGLLPRSMTVRGVPVLPPMPAALKPLMPMTVWEIIPEPKTRLATAL